MNTKLTLKEEEVIKVSPLVESLTGVIPEEQESVYKQGYYEYLNRKYSYPL